MPIRRHKVVISLVLVGGLSAALAGCAPGSSDTAADCTPAPDGTHVVLKHSWWAPGFEKVVDLWNDTHPDIEVQYSSVPAGASGTYTNYLNAIQSGTADDVLSIEYEQLPTFRSAGGLRNIYDCAGVPEAQEQFSDSIRSITSFGEKDSVYGVAVDTAPMGMYYRKDLFEQAGIAVPTTWDEYYAAAQKIRATGGYIGNLSSSGQNWWAGMAIQAGAQWFNQSDGTWDVSLTSEKSLQVADYWQQFLDNDLVETNAFGADTWNQSLASGQLWTVIGATWTNGSISAGAPDTSGKWALAPMPSFTGEPAAGTWGGVTFAVSADSEHPYEAAQFATWVATDPDALALDVEAAGLFPPSTNALEEVPSLSEPSEFFSGQRIFEIFGSEIAPTVPAGWQWGPTMVETYNSLQSEIGTALTGEQTLADAFAATQSATISAMKAQSIPVNG
ncbi:ABC transporter substrate-binding protein [Herbiconiux ginsengi]|uniref:Carbohydrate ABC transporter substrate-binding protein, CUT1 family n=1 Tax=Herbiconiux ginsengi TaxID=381665 RepID=A0A1H3U2Z7_9MICO|nr:sugar ABC transporter substrate-binding protein [Herbiconiux ginsengi]SDZ56205.1 carbohydrate ABC transporter substrate-binding protein, CUT1 family [Herbiconiux ginsengi]